MKQDFDTLSAQLTAARNRMAQHRHGGIVLSGDELEETIRSFTDFAAQARQIESQLSQTVRLRRAAVDCRVLVNGRGAAVLAAFRGETSNVVPFLPRSPDGGDAA